MNIWNRATRIPEIYGTIIALGLIVYFFIMYAAGLVNVIALRFLNLAIVMAGVYFALKQFKRTHNGKLDYFNALVIGCSTVLVGVATFTVFLFVYLNLDKNLMSSLAENQPLGYYLDPYIASAAVFFEGVFSNALLVYLFANFLATDTPAVDRVADKLPEKVEPMRGHQMPQRT
ncbi:DUF4199 domain-containing protein [Chryseosolibacter indicus]|uniref:DUF4199 family protein n=1 Tax=Chryseosolibacter indicus TaxID=2782351 RepID=A0ABS5VNZ4_9BACT|nr:DUF4199 domain-containing protein [Chryseosolibacter indicus]MBT1703153.1 DUF4199 family protein [Chryseosolibacter indicus]